ncbi:MAG TPA: type II toxin-antitoxin system RelE/ParE family toxin [Steroidobacteraceae bacterium]
MKGRFALAPRAQNDLNDIWNYTAVRWGIDQAETYIRQLWRDIATVAERSSLGRECPEVRAGYFRYPSGSHILFYRPATDGIDIVRILHQRMDSEQHIP